MMADMTGLFGPSSYEIEQQRLAQARQNAFNYSQMNATQRGVMGLHNAGSMFGGLGARALGGVDPAVQNAQITHEAAKQFDTSTPRSDAIRSQDQGIRPVTGYPGCDDGTQDAG